MWVRQFAVDDIDGFNAVAIDGNNDLILGGYTVAFKSNVGFEDALLMRYADTGTLFYPVISATNPFSPSFGPAGGTISINGGNFLGITGVRFNGVPAQFSVFSWNRIDAVVPAGATDGKVSVSIGCGCSTSTASFDVR